MIKKTRVVKLRATKINTLLDSMRPRFEFGINLTHELENLAYLAEIYKIDITTVNEAGVDLALAIARDYVKNFSPSSTVRGNPRNAYEVHKELFEAVEANLAEGLTLKAAIEKYCTKFGPSRRPKYTVAANYYHKAKIAKKKQESSNRKQLENYFSK